MNDCRISARYCDASGLKTVSTRVAPMVSTRRTRRLSPTTPSSSNRARNVATRFAISFEACPDDDRIDDAFLQGIV